MCYPSYKYEISTELINMKNERGEYDPKALKQLQCIVPTPGVDTVKKPQNWYFHIMSD